MDLKVFLIHYKILDNTSGTVKTVNEGNWVLRVDTSEETVTDAIVERMKNLTETSDPNKVVVSNVCLIESIPITTPEQIQYITTFDGDVAIAASPKPSLPTFL